MTDLTDRIGRLEDERDILGVLHTYGRALDEGLEAAFANCFTEDAALIWGVSPHRPGLPFAERRFDGRAAIVGAFRGHTHAPERLHRHLLYGTTIELDGDRATAHSVFERHDESPEGPFVRSFGRYLDELRRGEDGHWRLCLRRAELESTVPTPAPAATRSG